MLNEMLLWQQTVSFAPYFTLSLLYFILFHSHTSVYKPYHAPPYINTVHNTPKYSQNYARERYIFSFLTAMHGLNWSANDSWCGANWTTQPQWQSARNLSNEKKTSLFLFSIDLDTYFKRVINFLSARHVIGNVLFSNVSFFKISCNLRTK